jgi:N-acetylneuraminate synthase/sialic acid synthase
MRKLKFLNKYITEKDKPYVIAEVGHNHQGNLELCKKIFLKAKQCGASAVKLQKRSNKNLFSKSMYNQLYNSPNSYAKTYGAHREKLEFNLKQYKELKKYCKKINIDFFSTAFDLKSADFLISLKLFPIKIASGDCTNHQLLDYLGRKKIPMIISTGGTKQSEVVESYNLLKKYYNNFSILQCTSGYPPAFKDLNLNVIKTYKRIFNDILIGYSGHENGISMPISAYTLGAQIIEKHFTIDRTLKGTDQSLSLGPSGMSRLVRDLNRAYDALGDGVKKFNECEIEPLKKMVKIYIAKKDLNKNHIIKKKDLDLKIVGKLEGFNGSKLLKLIGKKLNKNKFKEEIIFKNDILNEK